MAPPIIPEYWWFDEATTAAMARRFAAPGARAKFRPVVKDGQVHLMWSTLPNATAKADDTTEGNESWPCPPVCPGGGG